MAASGIAANMSNTAETCCPHALLAAQPCPAIPRARARQTAPAAPATQPAQNAQTAGWYSARENSGNSLAVCDIQAVWEKPRSRRAAGVMSPSLAGGGGGEAQMLAVNRLRLCHTFAWSALCGRSVCHPALFEAAAHALRSMRWQSAILRNLHHNYRGC